MCSAQGWYWPVVGPQMTMYIPGPFLLEGENELILLEVEGAPSKPTGKTDTQTDRQTDTGVMSSASHEFCTCISRNRPWSRGARV